MPAGFREAVEALLEDLSAADPDWPAIQQAWLDASLEAAGTEYEQPLRNAGAALLLRDAEQLGFWLRRLILTRLDGTEPTNKALL